MDLVITNNSVHSTLSLASLPRQVQCLVEHWLAIPAHGAGGWSRHVLFSIFSSTGSNGYQHPGPKVDHTQNSKETPPQLWNCSARWDKILKKTNSARTFKRQRCAHRTASHCALCSQLSINRQPWMSSIRLTLFLGKLKPGAHLRRMLYYSRYFSLLDC